MSFNETIYKKDSKGKIRFLRVSTKGADLIQESGVDGSENVVVHKSTCASKNVGRSNETTPEQQAELEAASKIENKLSQGYFKDKSLLDGVVVILPMLAKEYGKESHKIDWTKPVYVQPKLDGMRALCNAKGMISRKGKAIDTVQHIVNNVSRLGVADYLDGELYAHGLNFQENMRLVKKYRPGETEKVRYNVYDIALPNMTFEQRHVMLKELVGDSIYINLVPTHRIYNEKELKEYHKKFLAEGYEGTMIRHSDAGYGINKRDSQLLKYKDFIDITLAVKGVVPMDKLPKQGTFIFDWPGATAHPMGDDILGCGMKFSHKEREEILVNKEQYIGKTAEIRFFEYSEDGVPRFPVVHGIRLDC